MIHYIRDIWQISILSKLFNIRSSEWRRVGVAWMITFLYRIGFVIGWTVLIGLFVSKYGISALPYFFVMNAVFIILGSMFYSVFLEKFSKLMMMIVSIFSAGITLFLAVYFSSMSPVLFFALLIVAEAIFLMQFKITWSGFQEEMFTPIESERTFPVIEAGDTFGGIMAGILVVSLTSVISVEHFAYLWIAVIFLIIPFLVFYERIVDDIEFLKKKKEAYKPVGLFTKLKKEFENAKQVSFIKGLFVVVFFQWVIFNLLEFQYTKAVYANVSSVVLEAGSGFEHVFVHDLGLLFILFSSSALLIQLFIGSRLIKSLGIIGSMILHPIVLIFSTIGLVFGFNFFTAVLAKNNFTVTGVLYNNSYHSSYYAVKEKLRGYTREFLEGMIRPLGALFGTFILIFLQYFLMESGMVIGVNISLFAFALILFGVLYLQQNKYTRVALDDLLNSKDKKVRLNAIDILSQRGHKFSLPVLSEVLLNENEPLSIRTRILNAFAELQYVNSIEIIIRCFGSSHHEIRKTALETLLSFSQLPNFSKKYLFVDYLLIEALKKLYISDCNTEIRGKIIHLLSSLSNISTIEFLLNILKTSRGRLKADVIYALGTFDEKSVVDYVKPYLASKNLLQKINAAIVLYKFGEEKSGTERQILSFLFSENPTHIVYGLYAVGELKWRKFKKTCIANLDFENPDVQIGSAIALAKMGCKEAIPVMIKFLFSKNNKIRCQIRDALCNVDVRIFKNIDRIVKHLVSQELRNLVNSYGTKELRQLDFDTVKDLRYLYDLVGEHDEVERIDNIINNY